MKFVHIADMHFDSPFSTLSDKGNLGEKRRIEQREIFKKVMRENFGFGPVRLGRLAQAVHKELGIEEEIEDERD